MAIACASSAVRLILFPSVREGTNIAHTVGHFSPFAFCYRLLNDFLQILILHPFSAVNGLLEYGFALGTSLLILALVASYAWSRKRPIARLKRNERLLLFLAMFFVSMLVIWGSGRQFYYGWGGNHYALPGLIWVCFALTAMLLSINNARLRSFSVVFALSSFSVYQFAYSTLVVKDKSYRMASYREALSKLPQGHDPEEFRLIRVNSPPRIIMGQYLHLTFIELTGDFWAAGAYEVDKGWTINENDYMESSRYFNMWSIRLQPDTVDTLRLFVSYPRTPLDIKNIGAPTRTIRWQEVANEDSRN